MFKKAGDNVHYLERTGSHSTKGLRTGRVLWRLPDDFMSAESVAARQMEIRRLKQDIVRFYKLLSEFLPTFNLALKEGNTEIAKELAKPVNRVRRHIRKLRKALKELQAVTPKEIVLVKTKEQRREERRASARDRRRLTE